MKNKKVCKLCGIEKNLKESHIIPKFVFRWLKQTGGKYIRKADNPNKRVEDGVKRYFLCADCEQIFSKLEDKFARDIFYPYSNQNIQKFKYDGDLIKFSISVLYRLLLLESDGDSFRNIHSMELQKALNEWNEFLFHGKKLDRFDKVHIFFSKTELNQNILPSQRFLNYYSRGIDGTIVFSEKSCVVYAKLARVILIGEITAFDNSQMKNTLINPVGGEIETNMIKLSPQIKQFLIHRVKQINELYDNVSEKQKRIAIDYSSDYLNNNKDSDISKIIYIENNLKIDEILNDFK